MKFLLTVDDKRLLLPAIRSKKTIFSEKENLFVSIFIAMKDNIFHLEWNMVCENFSLSNKVCCDIYECFKYFSYSF